MKLKKLVPITACIIGAITSMANKAPSPKRIPGEPLILYHKTPSNLCTSIKCSTIMSSVFCTVTTNLYEDQNCAYPVATYLFFTLQ